MVDIFSSLREFSTWYKLRLKDVIAKDVEKEKNIDEYFSKAKKRPLK